MKRLLLAGSTGYLGGYVLKDLIKRKIQTRIIVRDTSKLDASIRDEGIVQIIEAQLIEPSTLEHCCDGIDTVISTVGITRQKDGLTYMDVDYQANLNLLHEAKRSGVRKFIYVSVLNGAALQHLKICAAKERFAKALMNSGLDYSIVRPNGFFSDMSEFYTMAKKGTIYLFGNGKLKSNPIHGEDLAIACVNAVDSDKLELDIGGPQTLTQMEIAEIAFQSVGKKVNVRYIPDWIRKSMLWIGRHIMNKQKFGPIEFFMTVMAMDMIAPEYGKHTLASYFERLE